MHARQVRREVPRMKSSMAVLALATVIIGAGFDGSAAWAKCTKECSKAISAEAKTCKNACPKGSAGRTCKAACRSEKKADKQACKAATNPTPPGCGEASPSGAFLK